MKRTITPSLAAVLVLAAQAIPAADPASVVATFRVEAGDSRRHDTPVSASLDGLALNPADAAVVLYEVVGERRIRKPSQVDAGFSPRLWWILDGVTEAGARRVFELVRTPSAPREAGPPPGPHVGVEDDGDALTVTAAGKPVLSYRYTPIPPPAGTSALYTRSGFIHPLWSPGGAVLTRIQPPDHYHHVGLWNPWTRTEFEGRAIDFWNLHEGQGTVRFKALLSTTARDVFGEFRSLHEHVDLTAPDPSGARVALNEEWQVRVWNAAPGAGAWLVDFVSRLSCATASPLTIKKYRYQGFGFRATAAWDDETAVLLTSEGKSKSDGNATRARWCDVRGPAEGETAGVLFMTHPGNHDHPELLRIWPTGANEGKENVFVNFNPAQDRDWVLEPGHVYTLRYRMLVYDGQIARGRAERSWNDFASPPAVTRE